MSGPQQSLGRTPQEPSLPYGRHWIDEDDIAAVIQVLRSNWLTTGPRVEEFERALAAAVGARAAVAVSSGTAGIHAAMYALEIAPGDEVIVPPMTFAATANSVVFQGGTPVFTDVDPRTLLLDPQEVEKRINSRTKAIIAVDYAGQPCEYDALRSIASAAEIPLVADACHSLGAQYKERPVGALADLSIFSLHPVKQITSGEGGVVTSERSEWTQRLRRFRNHGIDTGTRERQEQRTWFYEMVDLGYNYRLTDFQCALGMSQLSKLKGWLERRQAIAQQYDAAFAGISAVSPLTRRSDVFHAYHLYVVQIDLEDIQGDRETIYGALLDRGLGVNVHYIPVHLHSFYRKRFGTQAGLCPKAERAYERILSLPIFPGMTDHDVRRVIASVTTVMGEFSG